LKIKHVTVTPIAFKDPPLLNASGIHEPYALRSIIEIESDNGVIGLGESYGDAPVLAILEKLKDDLIGLDPFNLNGLRALVLATVARTGPTPTSGAELAPGSHRSKAVANAYSAFEVAFARPAGPAPEYAAGRFAWRRRPSRNTFQRVSVFQVRGAHRPDLSRGSLGRGAQ
jgi:hypothetical protein